MKLQRRSVLQLGIAASLMAAAGGVSAQGGELRIGVLTPLTGGTAFFGTRIQTMISALADEINAAGGVNGAQLILTIEDDQGNPDAGVRAVRKLVDVNRVSAVIGCFSSAVSLAVMPVLAEAGIAFFTIGTAWQITQHGDQAPVFRNTAPDSLAGAVLAHAAMGKGMTKAALMLRNDPYGQSLGGNFRRVYEALGGTVTAEVLYEANKTNYRTEIDHAFAGDPDVVMFGGFTPDAIEIYRQAYELGTEGYWISAAFAFNAEFIRTIGADAANSILATEAVVANDSNAYMHSLALYEAAGGQSYDQFTAIAYDQLMLVALASIAAGSTEARAIAAAVRSVSNAPGTAVGTWAEGSAAFAAGQEVNYEGASGASEFDEFGNTLMAYGVYAYPDGVKTLDYVLTPEQIAATAG